MNAATVRGLAAFFTILFAIIAARQAYLQIVAAGSIAARPYNPRHALATVGRGRILASDGTVLAETIAGQRRYAMGRALAQSVGYVSARYGTAGIENAYDGVLTPPDTTGNAAAQLSQIVQALRGRNSPARGADVITTIEPAIETELYARLALHARGAGIVMDPRNGAVLAITSVPAFDPNTITQDFSALVSDARSPLLDRALYGLYPPGSTFKVFTASAALDSGSVTMESTFYDPGYLQVGNFTLHDNELEATGTQDLTGAFALSSNVDFGQIALKMGAPVFYRYLNRWGVGGSLDFQLPAARSRVPPQNDIFPGELAQMGFGQGALLASPMQMALIAATIAGDGTEPRPYIVREVRRSGAGSERYGPAALAMPIAPQTASDVRDMMIAVVQRGTGTTAQLTGVTVAGKTGTATNPSGEPHSWFVCFAPAQRPRVAVAVIVENAGYGADVAAPIARSVLQIALRVHST